MTSTSQTAEVHMANKNQAQKHNKLHCGACGFTTVRRQCPAKGKTCDKCEGQNHFASVATSQTNTGSHDTQRLKKCIPLNKAQATTMKPPTTRSRVTTQATSLYFLT